MPLKKCQKNGKQGWKWGDEGECYIGPSGKNKATRQGIAIEISKGNYTNQPSQISAVRDNYQETYKDYPKAASDNAKKALEWIEKYGRDTVEAGTRVGLARANQLAKGEPISRETIGRMSFIRSVPSLRASSAFFANSGSCWR